MSISTTTHLNFPGTARAALEFYASVFGATATVVTYGDAGMPADAPGADRVLFGQVDDGHGARVMTYDIPGADAAAPEGRTTRQNGMTITDRPFFLSLRGESLDEVTPRWEALSDGAEIIEPLAASPWSPGFGMLTDRFGVTWVIDVQTVA